MQTFQWMQCNSLHVVSIHGMGKILTHKTSSPFDVMMERLTLRCYTLALSAFIAPYYEVLIKMHRHRLSDTLPSMPSWWERGEKWPSRWTKWQVHWYYWLFTWLNVNQLCSSFNYKLIRVPIFQPDKAKTSLIKIVNWLAAARYFLTNKKNMSKDWQGFKRFEVSWNKQWNVKLIVRVDFIQCFDTLWLTDRYENFQIELIIKS